MITDVVLDLTLDETCYTAKVDQKHSVKGIFQNFEIKLQKNGYVIGDDLFD